MLKNLNYYIGILLLSSSLSLAQPPALTIFTQNKCTKCHSWSKFNINKDDEDIKAPDLSKLSEDVLAKNDVIKFLKGWLLKEEEMRDKKHRVKFKGSDEELDILVRFLVNN